MGSKSPISKPFSFPEIMPIPENQLVTWSHRGSVTQSSETYSAIKNALESSKAKYADKNFEVFLQGSYGNETNIYAESDVDIVIKLNSIMRSDLTQLSQSQQRAYHDTFSKAEYKFSDFWDGVLLRLSTAFGTGNIEAGRKAIRIKPNGSRRKADVIVCYQYRRYRLFESSANQDYIPGIIFPTSGGEVINFPKLHAANCTSTHQETNSMFKPLVRIMKNARSRLVEEGAIGTNTAPSYFIECLLFNVPDDKFAGSYGDAFCNCVNWLMAADRSRFRCANEQIDLFGDSNVQWNMKDCGTFLNAVAALWINWVE